MRKWIVLAWDTACNPPTLWESTAYTVLDAALAQAAWLAERDRLMGMNRAFTVVEVTP